MANAGPDKTGVTNVAVSFDGSGSTDSDGTVATWWWQYGDGGSDTKSVPTTSHVYTAAGTYSLQLWVRDNAGTWSAAGDTANVVISTGTTSTTIASGTTTSSSSSSTTTSSSTSTSTSHASTTSTAGTTSSTTTSTTSRKSTTTTSTTSSTTSSSTTSSTLPNQPPVANAGADQLTQTLTMLSFTGSMSNDPDGSIVLASWTFGDGATAAGLNVAHSYTTAGTYTATLTVIDNKGASDTDTAIVTVQNRPPSANAGPDETGPPNTSLMLNGSSSSDPDGSIVTYAWTFGDGTTGTGAMAGHSYTAPGTYTAWLTVTDNNGASASDNAVVTVSSTSLTWARGIGASGSDGGYAIVGDAAGNTIVGGVFRAAMTVGSTPLPNLGGADWFLVKYGSTGNVLWAKSWGGPSEDLLDGLAVDANGDVIATGRFSGTASFGGLPLIANGSVDMVVAKFNGADGTPAWQAKNFGGAYDDAASAVATDGQNNVYFTGYFRGSTSFGGATLTVPFDTDLDVFLVKLNSAGVHQWSKNFTNSGNDRGYGIAADTNGNVAITGSFSNTIDFGGGPLTSANGMTDVFVARFSTTGTLQWARNFGAPDGSEGGYGTAMDPSGNVFIAAYAVKPVDFGGGTLSALGGSDAIVAKYSATSGAHMWSRRLGGTGNDYAYSVAVDGSGNVFVAGAYEDVASFGGVSPLTAAGLSDAFVTKYGPTGSFLWAKSLGGTDNDLARSIGLSAGYPVTTGYFYTSGAFNGTTLTSGGTADAFVVRIAP